MKLILVRSVKFSKPGGCCLNHGKWWILGQKMMQNMMDGRLKQQKGDCVSPRNTVPLRARQYIKCLSKRRHDANVRIANRLFPCGGGISLACHVVDACLSCCVFHVLQITKEKWMICFGEVLRGALRYLDAKIIYHAPPLQV